MTDRVMAAVLSCLMCSCAWERQREDREAAIDSDVVEPGRDDVASWIAWHRQKHVIVGFVFYNESACSGFLEEQGAGVWPHECLPRPIVPNATEPVVPLYTWKYKSDEWVFLKKQDCSTYRAAYAKAHGIVLDTTCVLHAQPRQVRPRVRRLVFNTARSEWRVVDADVDRGEDGEFDLRYLERGDPLVVWALREEGRAELALFSLVNVSDESSAKVEPVCWDPGTSLDEIKTMTELPDLLDITRFNNEDLHIGPCWAEVIDARGDRLVLSVGAADGVLPGHTFRIRGKVVDDHTPKGRVLGRVDGGKCVVPNDLELIGAQETECHVKRSPGSKTNVGKGDVVILYEVDQEVGFDAPRE